MHLTSWSYVRVEFEFGHEISMRAEWVSPHLHVSRNSTAISVDLELN
jgi:hypothetical protein